MHFNFSVGSDCDRGKVQHVGFDSERVSPECGTVSDIRDRVKALRPYACASDVNAVFRNEFLVAAEVNRRHGVLGTESATSARRGKNAEGAAQEMTRAANAACLNELSDMAA